VTQLVVTLDAVDRFGTRHNLSEMNPISEWAIYTDITNCYMREAETFLPVGIGGFGLLFHTFYWYAPHDIPPPSRQRNMGLLGNQPI